MTNLVKINTLPKKQNKTTKKQNTTIDAQKLEEYIENVKKTKKSYIEDGIKIKWIDKKNVVDVDVEGKIKGDLDIKGTNVRKIKAKNIWGHINAEGVETLEEIEVEEEIDVKEDEEYIEMDFHINIKKTKVKTIKAKKIKGSIYADGVETLKEIEVEEEIVGNIFIKGTELEFQKKIFEKMKNRKFKINGYIFSNVEQNIINTKDLIEYIDIASTKKGTNIIDVNGAKITKIKKGGKTVLDVEVKWIINGDLDIRNINIKKIKAPNIWGGINAKGVETLEEIEVTEGIINGDLDIRGTSIGCQLEIIDKINKKELIVKGNTYFGGNIKGIKKLFNNSGLITKAMSVLKLYNNKNLIIPGNVDIRLTEVEFQKDIIKKINEEKFKINGQISFGGNIEGIEKLFDKNLVIPGNVDIRGINIDFQLGIIEKKKKGEFKINGKIFYNEEIINKIIKRNNK